MITDIHVLASGKTNIESYKVKVLRTHKILNHERPD